MAANGAGFYTVGVYEDKLAYSWGDIVRDADLAIRGFDELLLDVT